MTTTTTTTKAPYYEQDDVLRQYLEFHYGPTYFDVPNYPRACALLCLEALRQIRGQEELSACTALELGCAVGRSAFELAAELQQVTAVDLSSAFIATAAQLQDAGEIHFAIDREGALRDARQVSLQALGLDAARRRVRFAVGDACTWQDGHAYDLIFAGNLLDRLPDPGAFLRRLPSLLVSDGLVVISSPYTLREEFTPRARWLGGFVENGREITVRERMQDVLAAVGLVPVATPLNLPFVIRETARKYQHTVAELTVWRKRTG